jgi:hypothetical protein
MLKNISKISIGAGLLLPFVAFAQNKFTATYGSSVLTSIKTLVDQAIPLLIGLGVLFFLWGLVKFVLAAGNEEAKEEGKRIMIWGIVALFVMVSVWGLVGILQNITGAGAGSAGVAPASPGLP